MGKAKAILYVVFSLVVSKKKLILELVVVVSAIAVIWGVGIVPIYLFHKDKFEEQQKEMEPTFVRTKFCVIC